MPEPRISYVPLDEMTPEMRAEMERCAREGTPRPESSAVRAHVAPAFWFFANAWNDLFRNGIVDHSIKELCRVYVSRSVKCEYCGNQRSERGRSEGLAEGKYDELLNFESSETFSEREKAALAYAEAIAWTGAADDTLWSAYMHTSPGRARGAGVHDRADARPAVVAAAAEDRAPRGHAGLERLDGTGIRTADALAQAKASERYCARLTARDTPELSRRRYDAQLGPVGPVQGPAQRDERHGSHDQGQPEQDHAVDEHRGGGGGRRRAVHDQRADQSAVYPSEAARQRQQPAELPDEVAHQDHRDRGREAEGVERRPQTALSQAQ